MKPKLWVPEGSRIVPPTENAEYWDTVMLPYVDGQDIVARGVVATRFGGADDSMDGGVTASGFELAKHPDKICVSLPMRVFRTRKDGVSHEFPATAGSPLPKFLWGTFVRVMSRKTQKVVVAPLLDLGPAIGTGNAIDMSNALVTALGLSLEDGEYLVDFRVIAGATYLK
jgi:hypothetical protein